MDTQRHINVEGVTTQVLDQYLGKTGPFYQIYHLVRLSGKSVEILSQTDRRIT